MINSFFFFCVHVTSFFYTYFTRKKIFCGRVCAYLKKMCIIFFTKIVYYFKAFFCVLYKLFILWTYIEKCFFLLVCDRANMNSIILPMFFKTYLFWVNTFEIFGLQQKIKKNKHKKFNTTGHKGRVSNIFLAV